MVPLLHQAANPLQVSVPFKNSICCSGWKASHNVTGSTVVETGIAMQLYKSDSPDAAKLQIHRVSNLADWM